MCHKKNLKIKKEAAKEGTKLNQKKIKLTQIALKRIIEIYKKQ